MRVSGVVPGDARAVCWLYVRGETLWRLCSAWWLFLCGGVDVVDAWITQLVSLLLSEDTRGEYRARRASARVITM